MIESNSGLSSITIKHYASPAGVYLSWAFEYDPPGGCVEVPAPEYGDQIWQFPGWGPSPSSLRAIETDWRETEMAFIANNLLYIEDENPKVTPPLVAKSWSNYRIQVMAWQEGSPDFPDMSKRPIRPS